MGKVWSGIALTTGSVVTVVSMGWGAPFALPHYTEQTLHLANRQTLSSPWVVGNMRPPVVPLTVDVTAGDATVPNKALAKTAGLIQAVSLGIIQENIGTLPLQPAEFLLYGSPAGYIQAVAAVFPKSEVTTATGQTAGFTFHSDVVIPMYLYSSDAYLANTLTHELTHVTLNQDSLGAQLPTWINEGFAWYNGMQAEAKISPAEETSLFNLLLKGVEAARGNGQLLPLTAGEQDVLHHNAQYNLEFFDYLAVNSLIDKYGLQKFREFLRSIHGEGVQGSFLKTFGISLDHYERNFYQSYERVYAV